MQKRLRSGGNESGARANVFQPVLPFHRQAGELRVADRRVAAPARAAETRGPQDCRLHAKVTTLLCRLDRAAALGTDVIAWSSPVPSFGDISTARVATVGLNPSNREFVDEMGAELEGEFRRFHTLASLGLPSWMDADARHLRLILASCREYFARNPYDGWFKRLDTVLSGADVSFYGPTSNACHLDLIPFATMRKWTELSVRQRSLLLSVAEDTLGLLLRDSPIRVIVLNGMSVVDHFQSVAGLKLSREQIPDSTLPRVDRLDVGGYGFRGTLRSLAGIPLQREILILGYNHNLQSSFGVTKGVIHAIRNWLSSSIEKAIG
jgi:hypothetical protein